MKHVQPPQLATGTMPATEAKLDIGARQSFRSWMAAEHASQSDSDRELFDLKNPPRHFAFEAGLVLSWREARNGMQPVTCPESGERLWHPLLLEGHEAVRRAGSGNPLSDDWNTPPQCVREMPEIAAALALTAAADRAGIDVPPGSLPALPCFPVAPVLN